MQGSTMILLFSFVLQADSKELVANHATNAQDLLMNHANNAQESTDKLVNKLIDKVWPLDYTDLANTTLMKTNAYKSPGTQYTRLSSPSFHTRFPASHSSFLVPRSSSLVLSRQPSPGWAGVMHVKMTPRSLPISHAEGEEDAISKSFNGSTLKLSLDVIEQWKQEFEKEAVQTNKMLAEADVAVSKEEEKRKSRGAGTGIGAGLEGGTGDYWTARAIGWALLGAEFVEAATGVEGATTMIEWKKDVEAEAKSTAAAAKSTGKTFKKQTELKGVEAEWLAAASEWTAVAEGIITEQEKKKGILESEPPAVGLIEAAARATAAASTATIERLAEAKATGEIVEPWAEAVVEWENAVAELMQAETVAVANTPLQGEKGAQESTQTSPDLMSMSTEDLDIMSIFTALIIGLLAVSGVALAMLGFRFGDSNAGTTPMLATQS